MILDVSKSVLLYGNLACFTNQKFQNRSFGPAQIWAISGLGLRPVKGATKGHMFFVAVRMYWLHVFSSFCVCRCLPSSFRAIFALIRKITNSTFTPSVIPKVRHMFLIIFLPNGIKNKPTVPSVKGMELLVHFLLGLAEFSLQNILNQFIQRYYN